MPANHRIITIARLALLACTGCISNEFDEAPLAMACEVGVVRGHTRADVEEVARLAGQLDPAVKEIVRPRQTPPLRIVVVPQHPSRPDATTMFEMRPNTGAIRQFIAIRIDGSGPRRFLLAHELVHWYADWAWDHLPIAVEEGMADLVAAQLSPELGALRRVMLMHHKPTVPDIRRMLEVERGTERGLDWRSREMLYLVGRQVAERIGIDRLRSWCLTAEATGSGHIPLEWLLDPSAAPASAERHAQHQDAPRFEDAGAKRERNL